MARATSIPAPPPTISKSKAPAATQRKLPWKGRFPSARSGRQGRQNLVTLTHPRLRIEYRMNKLERRYAEYLEELKQAEEIVEWRFECIKWRLADRTWYTPDFWVICSNLTAQVHEVKGFWEDHARVKIKAVAELYPEFTFVAVQWKSKEKGGRRQWLTETFAPKS